MWEYKEQITPGYSLSQVTVPVIQQEYTSDTCLRSTMENDTREKSRFLMEMWNVFILSPFENTQDISDNFSTLSQGYFSCCLQCKLNPFFFFYFGCVLKPERIYRGGVSELFFMLVDECTGYSFGKKVFLKTILWEPLFNVFVFFINSVQHTLCLQVGFDIQAIL